MDFEKLKQNMIDMIAEQQIKLGYRKETVHLYYPLLSLNRILSSSLTTEEMRSVLSEFCSYVEELFGKVHFSDIQDRFCFDLPPETGLYVHEHLDDRSFLSDFIQTIGSHDCSLDELLQVFHRYSDSVHFEKMDHNEFDYVIYFEDGIPDDYRYCITDEGCHLIYHRFTLDDYEDFLFSSNS